MRSFPADMARWKVALVVGVVGVVVTGGVVALVGLVAGDDAGPAGAEEVADREGSTAMAAVWVGRADLNDTVVDDLSLGTVTLVRPADGDAVITLSEEVEEGYNDAYLVLWEPRSGRVERLGPVFLDPGTTAVDVAPDRRYAWMTGGDLFLGRPEWVMPSRGDYPEASFEAAALDVVGDGVVVVGSGEGPVIEVVSVGAPRRRLLGPEGDAGAEVTVGEEVGPIVSLVWLGEGRVAFVAGSPGGPAVYLLEGGEVRPVVAGGYEAGLAELVRPAGVVPWEGLRGDRHAMVPLGPGPGGRLVTIGLGAEGVPVVHLVDPEAGTVERVAALEGVEPMPGEPVSAAFAGQDLVFTAEGSVWRLPGALP